MKHQMSENNVGKSEEEARGKMRIGGGKKGRRNEEGRRKGSGKGKRKWKIGKWKDRGSERGK